MEAPGDLESMGGAGLDAPYLCYLLLGMGTLFPWNALITAAGEPLSSSPSSLHAFGISSQVRHIPGG